MTKEAAIAKLQRASVVRYENAQAKKRKRQERQTLAEQKIFAACLDAGGPPGRYHYKEAGYKSYMVNVWEEASIIVGGLIGVDDAELAALAKFFKPAKITIRVELVGGYGCPCCEPGTPELTIFIEKPARHIPKP